MSIKSKTDRLLTLKLLIEKNKISTQEELLDKLQQQGFELTQATLSRNLKQLKAIKIPHHELGYIYSIQKNGIQNRQNTPQKKSYQGLGFVSIDASANTVVIKTKPGYADRLAAIIDEQNLYEILGTIAGNDTILVILRESVSFKTFKEALIINIPELKEHI